MQKTEYKSFVGTNLPISTIEKIADFQRRYRVKTKSEAIDQLIDLAIYVESKIGLVESISSEEVQTIKEQIEKGDIVDFFSQMDRNKFSLLINIMRDEEKERNRQAKLR